MMAIVKNNFRVSKPEPDFSPETLSTNESEESTTSASNSDSDSDSGSDSDVDSGMESDSYDIAELGEPNTEFCQVGNSSFSIPVDLYDLPDLSAVLNLDTWNNCLSEEERFMLAEYLPDMDQETFGVTLNELFGGKNFHFGSPVKRLFDLLKGGVLEPRVAIYRRGFNYLEKCKHYHGLKKYQDSMVGSLMKIKDAWQNCSGYGIEERLRLLNIMRSQKSLGYEGGGVRSETDSESGNSVEWNRRLKIGKDNAKGILKVTPPKATRKELVGPVPVKRGFEQKGKGFSQVGQFDLGGSRRLRDEEFVDDVGLSKPGKRKDVLKKYDREIESGFRGEDSRLPQYHSKNRSADQGVTIASYDRRSLETLSKVKDRMHSAKDRLQVGSQPPFRQSKMHEESMSPDYQFEEWNAKRKKWKGDDDLRVSKSKIGFDSKVKSYKALPGDVGNSYFRSNYRDEALQGKIKRKSVHNGGIDAKYSRHSSMFAQSDETESDSSEEGEEAGPINPFANKLGYSSGAMEGHQLHAPKVSGKLGKVDRKLYSSIPTPEEEPYSTKGKQKSRTSDPTYMHDIKLVKKAQVPRSADKLQLLPLKSYTGDKKRKAPVDLEQPNYMRDYGSGFLDEKEEYLDGSSRFLDGQTQGSKLGNRYQLTDALTTDTSRYGRSNIALLGCNSVTKKRKGKDDAEEPVYLHSSPMNQTDETNFIKKKGKKKADVGTGSSPVVTTEPAVPEQQAAPEVEPEIKQQKKPFPLITPTKHTGFSFSIIHLLSAIRKAMVTPQLEDKIEENKMLQAVNGTRPSHPNENIAMNSSEQTNLPSLTVLEIVNLVKSNPGDPCILETQEPLQDLVRGVLKIFSSKTAPLGAKAWKALVQYQKSNKGWYWVGPTSPSPSDNNDAIEEDTSAEAWGIPHKMLVKLVDAFANWLKSGQETLQQIGSLPPPPVSLLAQLDEKERFRDLRAQKSLNTISPSTEEVRAYFRREELLRYSIPDRAFSYTAADGKKSIVAPLRRGGGKPTSKARDHFMLKPDRPPHVTILCLVRDAAARLPGNIGTRADVCTLIRDSQYIVEDVSDAQVNQVVSGALDRLHYERDPCVQFDGDRKLWVYLHRDREEEDFEDDGTSSTKKWKRQRKEADQSDTAVNDVSYPATGDAAAGASTGFDLNPDLNVDSSSVHAAVSNEPLFNDLRSAMENVDSYIDPPGDRGQSKPVHWGALVPNPLHETKLLCQENSTNEDYDDSAYSRENPLGLLRASLL